VGRRACLLNAHGEAFTQVNICVSAIHPISILGGMECPAMALLSSRMASKPPVLLASWGDVCRQTAQVVYGYAETEAPLSETEALQRNLLDTPWFKLPSEVRLLGHLSGLSLLCNP
jgi:hypothetical protein